MCQTDSHVHRIQYSVIDSFALAYSTSLVSGSSLTKWSLYRVITQVVLDVEIQPGSLALGKMPEDLAQSSLPTVFVSMTDHTERSDDSAGKHRLLEYYRQNCVNYRMVLVMPTSTVPVLQTLTSTRKFVLKVRFFLKT